MDVLQAPITFLIRELDLFLGFSWRDWSVTIIPASIFATSAVRSATPSLPSIISNYLLLVLWVTSYLYFFNLSNQIIGIDEDRINKPDRPIPSGKISLEGARWRWALALLTFLALGMSKPTLLPETICWVLTVAFLCLTSAGGHWLGKNVIAITTGTWALLSASWKVVAPVTPTSMRYVITLSVWAGLTVSLGDLRDTRGDAIMGRKTMPLVFGDSVSRGIITFLLIPASFGMLWAGDIMAIAPFILAALHIFLGYRVMQTGLGARYDHKTYMMYTYIFCLMLALTMGKDLECQVTELLSRFAKQGMVSGFAT